MRKNQGAVSDWDSRRPSIKSGNEKFTAPQFAFYSL
jgi:hypothetical protein